MGDIAGNIQQWLGSKGYHYAKGWQNFSHSQEDKDAIVVNVSSVAELAQIHKKVAADNASLPNWKKIKLRGAAGWDDIKHPIIDSEPNDSGCLGWCTSWRRRRDVQPTAKANILNNAYDESYSLSPAVVGKDPTSSNTTVITRFNPTFQESVSYDADSTSVYVPAGVQLCTLLDYLAERGRALDTSSMITRVTPIGLGATGGHGTGFFVPGFDGLFVEYTLIDAEGNLLIINKSTITRQALDANGQKVGTPQVMTSITNKDGVTKTASEIFLNMRAHLGLFGTVVGAKLKTIPNYGVREQRTTYNTATDVFNDLDPKKIFAAQNLDGTIFHGFTMLGMVSKEGKPTWDVRRWTRMELAQIPADAQKADPYYDPNNPQSMWQHIETVLGGKFLEAMVSAGAGAELRKAFCSLAADFAVGTKAIHAKDAKPTYGEGRKMEHYQVGFPKGTPLYDVSFITPVKQAEMHDVVPDVVKYAEALARKYWNKGDTPVMFAFYLRILDGIKDGPQNSGLQVTACAEDEKSMGFEFTTVPNAPGLQEFQAELAAYLEQRLGKKPRRHPGKIDGYPNRTYADFIPEESFNNFNECLDAVNGLCAGQANLSSPFMTDYLAEMLCRKPMPQQLLAPVETASAPTMSKAEIAAEMVNARQKLKDLDPRFVNAEISALLDQHIHNVFKANTTNSTAGVKY